MDEANPQSTNRCSSNIGSAVVPTDTDLLRRFATDRDETAFALLVERHGPLVLSVCRRVLGSLPDAEDAFQATFMVLARKAASIRDPGLLGNWLYGVASRIARKARVGLSKRQMHEKQVHLLPALQAPASSDTDDLCPVLDEELSRLPEKYRAALVLCYLEGRTNEEAAQLLRWPTGTVKGRLARARDLLRSRLLRRGWRMTALALAAWLTASRAEAGTLPPGLAQATAHAAAGFAAGAAASAGASAQAVRLAQSMLRSLRPTKWLALALLLASVAIGATVALVGAGAIGGESNPAGSSGGESGGVTGHCVHDIPATAASKTP